MEPQRTTTKLFAKTIARKFEKRLSAFILVRRSSEAGRKDND
jgi:hypothetical protein